VLRLVMTVRALASRSACHGKPAARPAAAATPLYLLRHWHSGGATAAQAAGASRRCPAGSPGKHGKFNFLGTSRLQLRLERMASLPPQSWEIEFDATSHLHMAPLLEAALADS
jgi:hypothetical protein